MAKQNENVELFEVGLIKEFPSTNITSIVEYKKNIIIGDSSGNLIAYKKENKTYVQYFQKLLKSKIDKLIVISDLDILYVLSGTNLYIYDLSSSFVDRSPKDSEKESKDCKDVAKIFENQSPNNSGEIIVVSKKKKGLFLYYHKEMQRILNKDFLDKDKKQLVLNFEDIPEQLIWYENNLCYYTKSNKLKLISIEEKGKEKEKEYELKELVQDMPVEGLAYIQSLWFVISGGCGMYFDTNAQPQSKAMIILSQEMKIIDLAIFNNIYIVILNEKTINIYDSNDGQCIQELSIDTKDVSKKLLLSKGENSIFALSSCKKDPKDKKIGVNVWEVREFSFEKQIKKSLKSNQIEKTFNLLNNKLDYDMEKFNFLESFYCDCAWKSISQQTKEGFEDAETYFGLFNFNPLELIYHFLKFLKIKPIHVGFDDLKKLPEIEKCQIEPKDINSLDTNTKAALQMLINVLRTKKQNILFKHNLLNTKNNKYNKITFESVKNDILIFESSEDFGSINLKDKEPKDIKLFQVLKIINEALVKAMVLLETDIIFIIEIINEEKFEIDFSLDFLSELNTFTSNMTLATIYKKQKKFSEALKILEKYINITESSNEKETKQAVDLFKKILISFGKNKNYLDIYEQGLKILVKNHYEDAFEVFLINELITIDVFLENILPDEPDNVNKRKNLLKKLCEDEKFVEYSNEKYQTLYLNMLINELFKQLKKEEIPKNKESEKFPNEYNDLKEKIKKYNNYNKSLLLENIKNTWMYDIEIYLLSQMQKSDEAIKKLIELIKTNHKEFEDIRQFCKDTYPKDIEVFKKYFKNLREKYDDKSCEDMKQIFKKEMLKLIDLFIEGELLDPEVSQNKSKLEMLNLLNPKEMLGLLPKDWKLNESLDGKDKNKTIFNLMHFYLKEYSIINNNYERLENLAKMDLTYKQKKLYELRDKHILLDPNSCCYLCGKKITNNTQFLVYPNGHIYHSKCSPDLHLEIKTGKNFQNFDY